MSQKYKLQMEKFKEARKEGKKPFLVNPFADLMILANVTNFATFRQIAKCMQIS